MSDTDAGVVEVVEVLERLDFDPPCGVRECEKVAAWAGRLSCCGYLILVCAPHRDAQDRYMAHYLGTIFEAMMLVHNAPEAEPCGKVTRSIAWTPLRSES